MATMTISLDDELRRRVEQTAGEGGYKSTSEVVREALRAYYGMSQRPYTLSEPERQAIQEGLESGESSVLDMRQIIQKGEQRLANR